MNNRQLKAVFSLILAAAAFGLAFAGAIFLARWLMLKGLFDVAVVVVIVLASLGGFACLVLDDSDNDDWHDRQL